MAFKDIKKNVESTQKLYDKYYSDIEKENKQLGKDFVKYLELGNKLKKWADDNQDKAPKSNLQKPRTIKSDVKDFLSIDEDELSPNELRKRVATFLKESGMYDESKKAYTITEVVCDTLGLEKSIAGNRLSVKHLFA